MFLPLLFVQVRPLILSLDHSADSKSQFQVYDQSIGHIWQTEFSLIESGLPIKIWTSPEAPTLKKKLLARA